MLRIALRHAGSFHYADDHNDPDDDHNDRDDDHNDRDDDHNDD